MFHNPFCHLIAHSSLFFVAHPPPLPPPPPPFHILSPRTIHPLSSPLQRRPCISSVFLSIIPIHTMQRIASKTRRERAQSSRSSAPWSPSAQFLTVVAIVLCVCPLASLALNWGDPCNPTGDRYSSWVFQEVCANALLACARKYQWIDRTRLKKYG